MPAAPGSTLVTRFAPSPTGYLHVGGARTALFAWLLARHTSGKFLLRIEDTDLARSTRAAVDALVDDLRWLGLNWDNDELVFQSQRTELYNGIIADLKARDLAYDAFETSDELTAMRDQAARAKRPFVYRRRNYTADEVQRFKSEGRPAVVRFAMPVREGRFHDEVLGKDVVQPAAECQDFVIRKADGMPTYHFGVVVDDEAMGCTHVLRGLEHLKNTFYHVALMEALGYARPTFAHLPVILNLDGSKMGKRDRDKKVRAATQAALKATSVDALASSSGLPAEKLSAWLANGESQLDPGEHAALMPHVGLRKHDLPEILTRDFRESGYLPEAMLNFLALLGWSPGGDLEQMPLGELAQRFGIEGIGKSNAKFDRKKLAAFNTDYVKRATPERLMAALKDWLATNPDSALRGATDDQLAALLKMNAGFRLMAEIDEKSAFFFVDDNALTWDAKAVEKTLRKDDGAGLAALREVRAALADVEWDAGALESAVTSFCERTGRGIGQVAQPLRVAVSGGSVSPPIFDSLAFLGRRRSLARIDRCLESVS